MRSGVSSFSIFMLCVDVLEGHATRRLVMDSGDGASHIMTIYEAYALLDAILRLIWMAMIFQSL